jgi:hypothetical protein
MNNAWNEVTDVAWSMEPNNTSSKSEAYKNRKWAMGNYDNKEKGRRRGCGANTKDVVEQREKDFNNARTDLDKCKVDLDKAVQELIRVRIEIRN